MSATVSAERIKLGQDFGKRFVKAVEEYDITRELNVTLIMTMRAETVFIRLERNVDGGLAYVERNVFYDGISKVGDQVSEAARLANVLVAALLLQTDD